MCAATPPLLGDGAGTPWTSWQHQNAATPNSLGTGTALPSECPTMLRATAPRRDDRLGDTPATLPEDVVTAGRPPLPLGPGDCDARAAVRAELDGPGDRLCDTLRDFAAREHGSTHPSVAAWNNGPFGPGGKFAHELATCVHVLPVQPPVAEAAAQRVRRAPRGWRRIFVGQCPGQYGLGGVAAVILQLVRPGAWSAKSVQAELPSRDPGVERHALLVFDGAELLFSVEPRVERSQTTAFFVTAPPAVVNLLLRCSGHVLCHPDCVTVHSVKYDHRAAVPPTETELHTFLHNVDVWAHADSPSDYVALGPDEQPRRRGFKRAAMKPMTFLSSAGPSGPSGPPGPSRRAGAPTAPPGL